MSHLVDSVRGVTRQVLAFDATTLAAEAGAPQALNTLMLGCLLGAGSLPCTADRFWETAGRVMPSSIVEANAVVFHRGVALGENFPVFEAESCP